MRDLVTRIAAEFFGVWTEVAQPFRLDSGKMRKPEELGKAIRVQAARVTGRGGVLVLRDGDDGDVTCPVELARMITPRRDLVEVPVQIVIARYEYESWFLATATSLAGHPAVRDDAATPADPEARCQESAGKHDARVVQGDLAPGQVLRGHGLARRCAEQ
ncbi:hypothetical protein [Kitasatospora purpeofusca]|uniref:hypothetical protein n=1 Tax=Kitasatospora purpeofusca TaxID=67352 RepID=UPI002A5B07DF|nr:hypothetical protein [Kitasatospora purpeofusca]MDY0811046.1 hypothetical protein [Kitasatospora purpeofusca]